MKKIGKIVISFALSAMVAATSMISASATTLLDNSQKVSFTMSCEKPGYTFEVYKVANLESSSISPYETKYDSLVSTATSADVTTAIKDGDNAKLLSALDSIDTMPTVTKLTDGVFGPTSATVNTKTMSDLDQGVYYVRAVNYPAGVQSVTNSVFALPYNKSTSEGWVYTIDDIKLAEKVFDKDIVTKKKITNSTKNNVNFTDVSLGDTVNFEIKSTVTGSKSMKLNSYYIVDEMSKGLTLDKESFNFKLLDKSDKLIKNLSSEDYKVTILTEGGGDTGVSTRFQVSLNKEYLAKDEFYDSNVFYTSITYSAVLNENAIVGKLGNPNEEVKIEYSNKNDVKKSHEGNEVYVYTYAVTNNKVDQDNRPLAGAEFKLYKTEEGANSLKGAIGIGVSDAEGKVSYVNSKGKALKLASGTYYVVETKAPAGYNLYGKVIKVDIPATYNETIVDGSYVATCVENGTATFTVTDSKIFTPKTGGFGDGVVYVIGGVLLVSAISLIAIAVKKSKKVSSKK